jgi:hypothetical protein
MSTPGYRQRVPLFDGWTGPETTGPTLTPKGLAWLVAVVLLAGAALFLAAPSPLWAADGAAEVCDGIDNDGDGDVDEGFDIGDADCIVAGALAPSAAADDPPPEVCDGVDNDGDGDVDEGFDVGADCAIASTNAFGTCETQGTKQCTADTTGTECVLGDGVELDEAEPEILAANDLSCFDDIDNDCDDTIDVDGGLVDGAPVGPDAACVTAVEAFCNGFDDDNDGGVDEDFGVGAACSEGIGECERTGSVVCDITDPTQQLTKCSVSAGNPSPENTPGEFGCVDGLDNDCDGLVDIADPSCQTGEVCDGLDNDGDGVPDEDFTDLGEACIVGVGACEVDGVRVCNAPGDGTQCNVVALLPGIEGPSGATCSDGIDNDCDGLVDGDDPSCASADIAVSCSLVSLKFDHGPAPHGPALGPNGPKTMPPGTSCEEKFRLEIESNVDPQFLTAEIMGLNPDGSLIDFSPTTLPVQDGDELHLNSRIDPEDWKVDDKGRFIDVFAPVPLVRVTADTGQNRVEAFCSHIPWLNVDKPSGADQVVSASEGNLVEVVVPIPRVDPTTLGIVVDGVDILDDMHLNVDPATEFPNPGAPISGTIDINGQMVTVGNLVVDTAEDLHLLGVNSLTMTLENLGGGGHIVVVNGDPRADALPRQTSAECHLDDVLDAGTVSVFGITIHEPAAGSEVPAGDTTVSATVSHGREIVEAEVQGVAASLGPQTCSPLTFDAFGETFSVDTCTREILETLPQTDLSMPLQLGTIDLGQNDLTIGAQDDLLNRVFARQRFTSGIGTTVPPGALTLSPQARAAIEESLELELQDAFAGSPEALQPVEIEVTADAISINLAFVFGITDEGINGFFQSVCTDALDAVEMAVDEALEGVSFDPVTIPVDGACDPTVRLTGLSLDFLGDLTCNVDSHQDFLTVNVTLPTIDFFVGVEGRCKDKFLGVCISEVVVNLNLNVVLSDFGIMFDLDEDLVLNGGSADPADFITGVIDVMSPGSGVEINCIAGFLADVLNFFSFGLIDFEGDATDAIQDALTFSVDIPEALRASNPDPLEVQKIEINEEIVEADGLEVEQDILQIMITEEGLTGTIGAAFTVPLPEEEGIEATILESPAPEFPIPNSKELFFAASDDIFNLLFAAIGLQGAFTTTCVDPDLTLEDTLPVDCDALVGSDPFQTDVMIGRCHGAKGIDCTTLVNPGQGFVCQQTKDQLAASNISKDTGLLFCANQPLAPRTLIRDLVPTPDVVEAQIHASDLVVTIALDRDGDDQFDPNQNFAIAQTCMGIDLDVTKDCKLSDACFDLNLDTEFTLGMPTPGSAQIVRTVVGVNDSVGMECGGILNLGSGPVLLTEAGTSGPVDTIQDNIEQIVQIFEALGLDLGSLVGLSDPAVLAIDVPTYADPDCADCAEYVGITGDIVIP